MKRRNGQLNMVLASLALLFVFVAADSLSAANYVVFVHGKGPNSSALSVYDSSRWSTTDSYGAASLTRSRYDWTRRYVNYDSTYSPTTTGTTRAQTKLASAISSYCSGTNKCYIICHSAGCYATGYWLAKNTAPAGILGVVYAASAAGGSPVADYGTTAALLNPLLLLLAFSTAGEPNAMTISLRQGTARGSYNHNVTGGKTLRLVAGYKSVVPVSTIVGGEDDKLVNFAGACGYNTTGNMTNCNDGVNPKYSYHVVYLNSRGAVPYNTTNKGYYVDHFKMQPVGRDALDRILGYL
jgi:triacylglycerol esterase/lipase EstA (alpha/beta hydrolase family)